jgi:hypothetical protein
MLKKFALFSLALAVAMAVFAVPTPAAAQGNPRDGKGLINRVLQAAVTGALVQETARAGNMLPREVFQALRNDKSLNDVIKEKGLDAAKITAAVTQTVTDGVNRRVKDGKLTQAQADALLAELPTLITETLAKTDWASLRGALGGRRNK